MKNISLFILLILFVTTGVSQTTTEDEFRSPLGIPLVLSGTFAELRGNHFHGGLDIKTNGKEGYRVYATKEGFVSRIKVKAGGYGHALYVQHPNGYTTVYGHLSKFSDKLASYVKSQQYANQSFEVDLYLTPNQFPVERGEVIALSGNSGSSGGPHLHYEIRKTAGQIPINPLKYHSVKDDINPTIYGIRLHDLTNGVYQAETKTFDVTYISSGNYSVSQPITTNANQIGISIKSFDKLNGANNSNGFYSLKMYVDGKLNYAYQKDEVGFDVTRHLNAHIDYPGKKKGGGTYVNLFKLANNQLRFYDPSAQNGRIWLSEYPKRTVKIEVCDYAGNTSTIEFVVERNGEPIYNSPYLNANYMEAKAFSSTYLKDDGISVSIPSNALYDDVWLEFYQNQTPPSTNYPMYSNTYQVHNETVPLQKFMTVEVRAADMPAELKSKAVMANLNAKGNIDVNTGKWIGDVLQVKTRNFGLFFITTDTTAPVIRPYGVPSGSNYNATSTLRFKISDDLSGVKSYRAEVDGKWILMEYDPKNNLLTHKFDGKISSGKHTLVLTVKDYVGNTTTETFSFTK